MRCKENQDIFTCQNFFKKRSYSIPTLPLEYDLETKAILGLVAISHKRLAELKRIASTIPNEQILINTLTLQEAKENSAIENIITTDDELFKAELLTDQSMSSATKEVQRYANAPSYKRLSYVLLNEHSRFFASH